MDFGAPQFPPDFDVWEFALKHFPTTPKYNKIIAPYKNLTEKERDSLPFIKHCLSIYLSCPEIYNLSQKHFQFVETSKFSKITRNVTFRAGLNEDLLDLLEIKVKSLNKNDRYCVLAIEEVSLKTQLFYNISRDEVIGLEDDGASKNFLPAKKAYVVIANGIYTGLLKSWKQPIAYFLSSVILSPPEVALKVLTCIDRLQKIDLHVVALVSSKPQLARILNISPEKPYFGVNKEKIFFFYDTGRLMVKTRNVLKNYQIVYGDEKPSWKDVEEINEKRPGKKFSLHKLKDRHVDLEKVTDRRSVVLATETLAYRVAAAMSFSQNQPPNKRHTSQFILRISNMYNIFNSPVKSPSDPKYYQPYKDNKVQHFSFRKFQEFTKNVKVYDAAGVDITHRIRVFNCWNINMISLQMMWNMLKYKKFKHLFTSWINLNYMRRFLKEARQNKPLTANQLSKAFKKEFTKCLFYANEKTTKEQDKYSSDLIDSAQIGQFAVIGNPQPPKSRKVTVRDCDYRYHNIDTLTYKTIRSYLLKQCRDVHYCRICGNFSEDNPNFVEYVCKLDSVFEDNFVKLAVQGGILQTYISMCELFTSHPCNNFPKKYLLRLFARMKMFYCLKTANGNFKQTPLIIDFSFGMMPAF